ncbi:MAG TPA: hypothetical protein VH988_05880 [Thermoanaerobaculia bacterium]|jgi:hypothetical protein|nr:hypothetical protein [Thermoanaerobaculia bacterium]
MTHHSSRPRPTALPLCLLAITITVLIPSAASADQGGLRCQDVTFPVTLSTSDHTIYHVYGELCSRGSIHDKTIQVALHGATYSHIYWDWPYLPEIYSYARYATAAGYAGVLRRADLLGLGQPEQRAELLSGGCLHGDRGDSRRRPRRQSALYGAARVRHHPILDGSAGRPESARPGAATLPMSCS